MSSIARICEQLLERKPFLQEALSRGLLNYGALAEELLPEIEQAYGKKVKFPAIVMALRRLREKIETMPVSRVVFDTNCNLRVTSDLFELSFVRHPDSFKLANKFYNIVDPRVGDFFTVTTGSYEVTLISNKRYKKKFLALLNKKDILSINDNLAALSLKLPLDARNTPGIFYLVSRALVWEGISIVEVVSTYTEDTLILRDKDVSRSYDLLNRMLKNHQK